MTGEALWLKFMEENHLQNREYDAWCFGGDADLLAALVVEGKKTATSSAYPLYALDNEPLPQEGTYSVILNSRNEAVCVIRTIKVSIAPFDKITEAHAYREGEGDRSLKFWKTVHEKFFSEAMKEANLEFRPDMKVVCEEFEVVFKP